jgi:aspartyl-tRNA(Asn)/glutamyl-tRNA(Gln) amidotransferase subunit B
MAAGEEERQLDALGGGAVWHEIQQVSELISLVEPGELTDRLARQALEGGIAGEGRPSEAVAARGLAVVSDDGALLAAVDAALAKQPDVLEKLRDGKVQAAGAIIGAVMNATGGPRILPANSSWSGR